MNQTEREKVKTIGSQVLESVVAFLTLFDPNWILNEDICSRGYNLFFGCFLVEPSVGEEDKGVIVKVSES